MWLTCSRTTKKWPHLRSPCSLTCHDGSANSLQKPLPEDSTPPTATFPPYDCPSPLQQHYQWSEQVSYHRHRQMSLVLSWATAFPSILVTVNTSLALDFELYVSLTSFYIVLLHLHRSWWLLLARHSSAFRILCFPLAFVLSSFLKCPVFALPRCSLSRWSKVLHILFWGAGDLSLKVWKDMKELDWWMVERSLGVLF